MPDGSASTFEEVIDAHWGSIVQLAYRMTGDASESEEIAQQTFFLAYRAWPKFEQRSSVLTWLYRIAVNACKRHLQQQRQEPSIPLEDAPTPSAEDRDPLEAQELRDDIHAAMKAISPAHRVVLTLFCVQELDHAAIAEILGCPIGTVWSRLFHARAALAKQLKCEVKQ